MDEDAQIVFMCQDEAYKIQEKLQNAWYNGKGEYPQMDMYEDIGDWFRELDMKPGCEELKFSFSEALYHISNNYYLSYYIQWSIVDMPEMENPFLPYYKLWSMGFEPIFASKDKVIVGIV